LSDDVGNDETVDVLKSEQRWGILCVSRRILAVEWERRGIATIPTKEHRLAPTEPDLNVVSFALEAKDLERSPHTAELGVCLSLAVFGVEVVEVERIRSTSHK
jgi:hypothetical protein